MESRRDSCGIQLVLLMGAAAAVANGEKPSVRTGACDVHFWASRHRRGFHGHQRDLTSHFRASTPPRGVICGEKGT